MQTIVELLLKSPRKLSVFYFARAKQENICMDLWFAGCGLYFYAERFGRSVEPAGKWRIANLDFHAFRGGTRAKNEQWMLVACEFGTHFFSESVHFCPAADADSNSPRAAISAQTFSNAASALASNRTKLIFSSEVGPFRGSTTSRSMIWA